ncbi:MAG: flavin reductase [Candidatus Omnitrophica bacterium]|nr:flavin reductase [Candidatus Omnitrophota bacterium]
MPEIFYDLTQHNHGMNYRWIQPPQICYFVSTVDSKGNVNCAGATLGTCVSVDMELEACGNFFFTLSLGYSDLPHVPGRQSQKNLHDVPEVVISYIGNHMFREAQIACLPIPKGINEMEVMGMTPLPSHHVQPPGLKEALINIEGKVISSTKLAEYYELYVCQAVGVSVDEDLVKKDEDSRWKAGAYEIDPLFEVTVLGENGHPPRLYVGNLDKNSIRGLPDDFGPWRTFVGRFDDWIEDEVTRGKIGEHDKKEILELNEKWRANMDPVGNAEVKKQLTERLKDLMPERKES